MSGRVKPGDFFIYCKTKTAEGESSWTDYAYPAALGIPAIGAAARGAWNTAAPWLGAAGRGLLGMGAGAAAAAPGVAGGLAGGLGGLLGDSPTAELGPEARRRLRDTGINPDQFDNPGFLGNLASRARAGGSGALEGFIHPTAAPAALAGESVSDAPIEPSFKGTPQVRYPAATAPVQAQAPAVATTTVPAASAQQAPVAPTGRATRSSILTPEQREKGQSAVTARATAPTSPDAEGPVTPTLDKGFLAGMQGMGININPADMTPNEELAFSAFQQGGHAGVEKFLAGYGQGGDADAAAYRRGIAMQPRQYQAPGPVPGMVGSLAARHDVPAGFQPPAMKPVPPQNEAPPAQPAKDLQPAPSRTAPMAGRRDQSAPLGAGVALPPVPGPVQAAPPQPVAASLPAVKPVDASSQSLPKPPGPLKMPGATAKAETPKLEPMKIEPLKPEKPVVAGVANRQKNFNA